MELYGNNPIKHRVDYNIDLLMSLLKQMLRLSKYLFLVIFFQACFKLQAQNLNKPRDSIYTYTVVNALLKEGFQRKMFPGVSADEDGA